MRLRLLLLTFAVSLFATSIFAKDVYLSIAGTVSNFHTDARIFNPSATKDITIQAYFLPVGLVNNSGVQPVNVTVTKRSMKVLDDVVTALFNTSGIGAIRLSCADDFVATSRIYAQTASGTLGQFVQGLESTTAKKAGVLIQIKSNSSFRTNIGAANPNGTTANVTWRLYDKNNALIGTGKTEAMPPYGVLGPTNVTGYFGTAASVDLSDAWVSFTSDQPIFAYVSVLDNITTDPTYIPADTDSSPPAGTTIPTTKVFSVSERSGVIAITPDPNTLALGDTAVFNIVSIDFTHGFEILGPNSSVAISATSVPPGPPITKSFTVTKEGTYLFFCTISSCSAGHASMSGTFVVGAAGDPPDRPGY